MKHDVVENGAQRIVGVLAHHRVLDGLADRDAQGAGAVRVLGQDGTAGCRVHAGAGDDAGPVCLHHHAAVRLLVVAGPHHVNLDFDAEHSPGVSESTAPLAGASLGGDATDALFLVVEGLRDRGVGLVAAGRAAALVLVIDVGGRIQSLLKPKGTDQGTRPELLVQIPHGIRDLDLPLCRDFLHDQGHREERGEVGRTQRLMSAWVQRW